MPIDSQQQHWNRFQAQKILECGYLDQSVIQRFLLSSHNENHIDLCESLHRAGQLSPEQVQFIRSAMFAQKPSADSSFVATVINSPPSSLLSPSATPQSPPTSATQSGPHFERMDSLGKGGMGEVFLVKDQRLNREAALKIVNKDIDNLEGIQRFLREAELTAGLDHPCIPPVYEVGRTPEGEHYMLMKVIRGETLKTRIDDYHKNGCHRRDLRTLLTAFTRVAEAVAYSHSQKIIHRDLKPSNIMVGAFGEVMVLDWGLARELGAKAPDIVEASNVPVKALQDEGLTLVGAVVGTPGFMAPEQARGELADAQSDVYGLGAILTYLLTKQCPVKGDNVIQLTLAAAMGKIHSPLELKNNVDPELAALAVAATRESKEARLEGAQQLLEELQRYLAGDALDCYQYNASERTQRWIRRHPLFLLTLIAVIVTAFLLVQVNSAIEKEAQARQEEAAARQSVIEKEKLLDNLELAKQLAQNRINPEKLKRTLTEILNYDKSDPYLMLTVAKLYEQAGLMKECTATYQEATKFKKTELKAYFELHKISTAAAGFSVFQSSIHLRNLTAAAAKHEKKSVYSLWVKAFQEKQVGNPRACIQICTDLIDNYSKNFPLAYYTRGFAYEKVNEYEKAREDYKQTALLSPEFLPAYHKEMTILVNQGKHRDALKIYQSVPPVKYKNSLFDTIVAACYRHLKQPEKALFHYERIHKHSLQDIEKRRASGRVHWTQTQNLTDFPLSFYFGYSSALFETGRHSEAIDILKKGLSKNVGTANAHSTLGRYYNSLRQFTEAQEHIQQALKIEPSHALARKMHIQSLLRENQLKEALKQIRILFAQHPNSSWAYAARAEFNLKKKLFKKSLADLDRAIELTPNNVNPRLKRAQLLRRLGQFKKACQDFKTVADSGSNNNFALLHYGITSALASDYSRAITVFTQLIDKMPKDSLAYQNRGQVYLSLRLLKLAEQDLSKSIELRANSPSDAQISQAYILRARCREQRANKTGAIQDYQSFLKAAPPNFTTQIRRAKERIRALQSPN